MKKLHPILICMAVLAVTGCSKKNDGEETPTPIRLVSGIEAHTRAFDDMNTGFPSGRRVAFYVDEAAASSQLYGNNVMTTDGSDGFTGGAQMYFPDEGQNVSVYGIHTNGSLATEFPSSAVSHTVSADQKLVSAYYDSDLLYGIRTNVAKTQNAVEVKFYHMLSKVRVAIVPGDNSPDLAGATVKILGTKTTAGFTPSKAADMTQQTARAAMLTATGDETAITVGNEPSVDFAKANVKYNDAIVVPQTVAAGNTFIWIELASGERMTYDLPADLSLQGGRVYTYDVKVNAQTGLDVNGRVEDWDDAGTTAVEAE